MYLVFIPNMFGAGHKVEEFEHLDEAKERVKEVVEKGCRSVRIAREMPMKLKVEVEI
ncbi:hypothetical protein [Bacillus badius]|uniref:Uncharacterized protein n=1 Tax=Bacillus badius TaxID=1455 RepID=A0ABR5AQR1_BACBA|nr:hypothetical protein [Bacillus badius]KIL73709.1 hypothetical protein SD77_2986 [Bacillus badius]MED4715274.1 hypothetical protein [Bacillus badius]